MNELAHLSFREIVSLIKSKEVSQKEVWDFYQNKITNLDPKIEAFNAVYDDFEDQSLDSVFAGAPIGVKDLYSEKGKPTTAGSKMLEQYTSPYESTATKKLKAAGIQSIGKLNCDEFAMGTTGENSALKTTKNPWDVSRVPGGSSSGSAAAVAGGLVPVALGTDTGGSIRQPAGLSGCVGFKGTYGRVSRYGVIPMASSFDTMGVFARNVQDTAFVWEQMAGKDPMDATSLEDAISLDQSIWDSADLKGMRIGVPEEYFKYDGLDEGTKREVGAAIKKLRDLGAEVIDITLPLMDYAVSSYYVLIPSEVSTNLGRFDGIRFGHKTEEEFTNYAEYISHSRTEGFGPEAIRRIMIGTHALSAGFYDAYYNKAALVRQMVRDEFAERFHEVDVIVSPVSPMVAWGIGELADDPLALYLADIFTIPAALAGLPGISVPCGFAKPKDGADVDLPVGLQIVGPQFGEEKVFKIAHVFEQSMKDELSKYTPSVY